MKPSLSALAAGIAAVAMGGGDILPVSAVSNLGTFDGVMQFMVIQLIGLALILLFPQLALWLPTAIYGG